jgi:transcriptional regulator with XRE-family HTH domain
MSLAEAAGMHFTFISSIERGERNVSLETIVRLSVALDMDPAELLRGITL